MAEPFSLGVDITLDGSGAGTARLGPTFGPPLWHVTAISVRTSQPGIGNIPQCSVYRNTIDTNGFIDGTYDGSMNSTDVNFDLAQGGQVIAVWSGGNAGNIASLVVHGTRE